MSEVTQLTSDGTRIWTNQFLESVLLPTVLYRIHTANKTQHIQLSFTGRKIIAKINILSFYAIVRVSLEYVYSGGINYELCAPSTLPKYFSKMVLPVYIPTRRIQVHIFYFLGSVQCCQTFKFFQSDGCEYPY